MRDIEERSFGWRVTRSGRPRDRTLRARAVIVRRRLLIAASAVAARGSLAASSAAPAARPRSWRVVHLSDVAATARRERAALLEAFARSGHVQGRDLTIDTFDCEGVLLDKMRSGGVGFQVDDVFIDFFARETTLKKADLLLVSGDVAAGAAQRARIGIPVVFWGVEDPVGLQIVKSLARPGTRMTGFAKLASTLTQKRLDVLQDMVPNARRIAVLFPADHQGRPLHPDDVATLASRPATQVVNYGVQWATVDASSWHRFEPLFETMKREKVDAFLLPLHFPGRFDLPRIVGLAERYRLPTVYAEATTVTELGGLAAYVASTDKEIGGAVQYAIRILEGESPADLPVQEPSAFDLLLNSRAVRDLGLSLPPAFLLRVTRSIEK